MIDSFREIKVSPPGYLHRSILEVLLCDRLNRLDDQNTHKRLQLSTKIPISVRIKDPHGNPETVEGKADWAFGYWRGKHDIRPILLVILEAKTDGETIVDMPQLLVCIAAAHRAHRFRNKRGVFGVLSDSKRFTFAVVYGRKFFTSRCFDWFTEEAIILKYIDTMLRSVVK